MKYFQVKVLLICALISFCDGVVFPGNMTTITFNEGLKELFGENNIHIQNNGKFVSLSLNNQTGGSGFVSQTPYKNGLFSASIKLPSPNYTAGIVVAFYLSNSGDYHDEIDFEFLGHAYGQEWVLQTNYYGNGSTSRGREERYKLWFDPSEKAHRYSVFWAENRSIIYVDDVPIRHIQKVDGLNGDYPSKPMSLYATIWDGSDWATEGGRYRINHELDPYVAEFSDIIVQGCSTQDSSSCDSHGYGLNDAKIGQMTPTESREYEVYRKQYLTYSYCNDKERYNTPLPECLVSPLGGKQNY